MKAKINLENIKALFIGNYRHTLYWSPFRFLIRKHIKEQFEYRVESMHMTCNWEGSCKECGCLTTNLQMANKACDGNCYPTMLGKIGWQIFKRDKLWYDEKTRTLWKIQDGEFKIIKKI